MTDGSETLGVIFDMDGVLVDTGWAHRQAWFDTAAREGFPMSDEFFWGTFGMQNAAILPMLRPGISKDEIRRLSQWKEQRYREVARTRPDLAPGAISLLKDLKQHGFRLAIGSSAPPENLDVFWDAHSLADYFDARVTSEQVTESKPSPQTFLKAAEKLGLPPSRCAVVEDALQGVQAGKAGGMVVVAVTTTHKREDLIHADYIVDNLTELKAADFLRLLQNGQEPRTS
ncbi:MAG TPA: HAD family phosphatase [Sedimentisphaerales bacterium]|nr:HAD family phosphatase [Sedimentisphaerales bacterium]